MGEQEEGGAEGGERNNSLQTQQRKIPHRKRDLAVNNHLSLVQSSSSPLSKGLFVMNFTASCVSCGLGSGRWSLLTLY